MTLHVVPASAFGKRIYVKINKTKRKFGRFEENILEFDYDAKRIFEELFASQGYEADWKEGEETCLLTKTPVILLIKIMLFVEDEKPFIGAYSVSCNPDSRTSINVIAGRITDAKGRISVQKFSLYYPDNKLCYEAWGRNWSLLHGFSFRTGVVKGTLNRIQFIDLCKKVNGLRYDENSLYEDASYFSSDVDEKDESIIHRVNKVIQGLLTYKHVLSMSFDPSEKENGVTAVESEWKLLLLNK